MDTIEHEILAVTLITMLVVVLVGVTGLLLVVNANRRHRHRAQLVEVQLRHGAEVNRAEREAIQHTLRDVGSELHDNVGHLLEVARMGVAVALKDHPDDPRLTSSCEALTAAAAEVRRVSHSLHTDMWDGNTLLDAITTEAERIQRVGRVRTPVQLTGLYADPPSDTRMILFRVFQEVITNSLKHSGADTIGIHLEGDGPLRLTITDNGRGFDPAITRANGGLTSIRDRCALVGYEAALHTTPGHGCTWHIRPLEPHGAHHRPGG